MGMFDFKAAEKKWQFEWEKAKLFEANPEPKQPKFLITFPYPYLNGAMHMGHSYSFIRTDVYARYKRLQGFNVLFPQGFHATGEPIMGTVERLRNGDAAQIENFKKAGATEAEIEGFKKGPEEVARFWMQRWIFDLQSAGASIDWRRKFITTDLTPAYSRFIEWQYNTLRKKGYVVQGTHPVIWCPHDNSPTGDHDRYIGEGESPAEYQVIKFELSADMEKLILPCATLRPETVYGATNLWINPDGIYVKAKVDGELWVISEYAAVKLADQQHKVEVLGPIDPRKIIGKKCRNLLAKKDIPIFPAGFVIPEHATGVVMSVPAHAPYDYIALEDLKKDKAMQQKFGLNELELASISPISIISLEGYSLFPAAEECAKLGITSQKDTQKLEKATNEIYKQEFHKGKLREAFGAFAGKTVSESKEPLIQYFRSQGAASKMWESTGPVMCRCMTKCHVKILENQWFLKLSDRDWKNKVQANLKSMAIYPQEARPQMENTIEWLQNKACARKGGLGTKLPWDKEWKVETLSDSTIYMAYYTIARSINVNAMEATDLTDEVFDYIFTGVGNLDDILTKTHLNAELILEMKGEFDYFYPVDLRNSGKDLLQNHLLFYLFHHAAIFRQDKQPRGISVNGYVTIEGEKMSKSKGNFIPIRQMIAEHGADLVRINIAAAGEGMDDADWRDETLKTYSRLLDFLYETALKLNQSEYLGNFNDRPEKLLESRLGMCVKNTSESMERLNFRTAIHHALFESTEALKKYLALREKESDPILIKSALEKICLLLCPFTPHFSEEIYHTLGNGMFCSISKYPIANLEKIDMNLEEEEKYLENVASDIQKIIEITKSKPGRVMLFTCELWKTALFKGALQEAAKMGKFDVPALIKRALTIDELKPYAVQIPGFLLAINKAINYYKANQIPDFNETELLQRSIKLLEKRFGCKVLVYAANSAETTQNAAKAAKALPFKPAILITS
jgi:leucyl-tRNA synthetase